jgi:hypothetical protein
MINGKVQKAAFGGTNWHVTPSAKPNEIILA